ncbi:MAG: hypothetical protein JKY51_02160 [Opitutaceae bacterium]|nr:hypothetical protein [Opitutaceae bacterium]
MKKQPSLAEQVHYRRKAGAKKSSKESMLIAGSSILVVLSLLVVLGVFHKSMRSILEKEEKIVIRGVSGVVEPSDNKTKGPPPSPESAVAAYLNVVAAERVKERGVESVIEPVLEVESSPAPKDSIVLPIDGITVEVPGYPNGPSSN